jgi:lysozyme
MDIKDIASQLRRDEGLRLHAYKDSLGYFTIGYGELIEAIPGHAEYTVTQDQAEEQLQRKIAETIQGLMLRLPWFTKLSLPRQGVLINMGYNLGLAGLMQFHTTLRMIEAGDYVSASKEMLHSVWAGQVGDRAKRLSRQLLTDIWQ